MNLINQLHQKFGIFKEDAKSLSSQVFILKGWIGMYLFLAPALILFFVPFLLRPTIFSGDEPHYLLVANSILKNHSLDLRKIYEKNAAGSPMAGKAFAGASLDHHTALVDVGHFPHKTLGQWHQFFSEDYRKEYNLTIPPDPPLNYREFSVRAVGWPFIVAVGSLISGLDVEESGKILSHLCVLLAALFVALTLRRLGCESDISVFCAVTILLGSSYWIFANTAMAESILGATLACVIYAMVTARPILLGVVLALGAWMKFQFFAPAGIFFLMGLVLMPPEKRMHLVFAFAICLGSALAYNVIYFGQIKPPMAWLPGNPFQAISYFFLAPKTSILFRNPWVCALVFLFFTQKKNHKDGKNIFVLLVAFLIILICPSISVSYYDGGYGYPCRLIEPTLIVLSILLGLMLRSAGQRVQWIAMGLLTISILINLIAAISDPRLTWSPTWIWMEAFLNHLS